MKAVINFFQDNGKFEATHEIEVPDGAYECHGHFHNHQGRTNSFCIPIYHPKKVKKWRWVKFLADNDLNEPVGTITGPSGHYSDSDDEIDRAHWRKIPETMIEVEE